MVISEANLKKLEQLNNKKVMEYLQDAIDLCKPAKVTVITDSEEDINYVKELALKNGEESKLRMEGHTVHFDGINDQGRDKANTRYLVKEKVNWGIKVNDMLQPDGVAEVREIMDGIMEGKEMLVSFFSLGPTNSPFSQRAMQITDSAYVTHSEQILYRTGYEEFKRLNGSDDFFLFLHSAGELENGTTKNIDKRRIFIDLVENRVYTVNNQYAGNSVGLKKLAFRLAIQKANNEDWLAEHMFLMGVQGKPGRKTYFAGAFPSACGKTSTAMLPGQTIVGDDIAYLKNIDGKLKAVNVEKGIFGIIQDVNPEDDPLIYEALTTPREVIFSNVLVNDDKPYWLGMGQEVPDKGRNFSGEWYKGKKDANGKEIDYAHKNARYTIAINELANADDKVNDPNGVEVQAIVYGGRDSDTTVPVAESLSWSHGVFVGATIESETTAAILGKEGVRNHDPMANLDFLVVPLGKYVENHLKFGNNLDKAPTVYSTNYFLKGENGKYLNGKLDKKVWILWAEGRVNGEYDAIETPIGRIPKYEDLKELFKANLDYDYTVDEYNEQFSVRVGKYLEKMDRMSKIFSSVEMPESFLKELNDQVARLKATQAEHGDVVKPEVFAK
ncbi:MAG: phosphoenolpyruvate carboxykinase (GTP) [Caldicoprobacterales bacterium]|jgi:phosphoenolpyruvate carboxykinase (GTP)|nr:phosphoenolpyruvate carboxykinase (GTP) [Clostridiales bacterium]